MDLDARTVQEDKDGPQEQVPNETHEVLTGRFARSWTVGQVSTLLRKSASQPPAARAVPDATPIPQEIVAMAADLAEYTPGELEELKAVAEAGAESDIVETAVRTLIYLLPMVRNPYRTLPQEKELSLFAGVIRQLEDLLSYLLKRKDYDMACLIIRALRMPVDPAFRPRAAEALKKASSRNVIAAVVTDLRKFPKDSARYRAAYSYLELLHGDATPMLLEILAEEPDRLVRRQLIDILKDLGKNQLALLGQRLSDERWYFVRNIVSILGDSRTDEAVSFLEKVSDHKNFQIRQEVVRALITIGGRKAVGLLTRFLNDRDVDIRFMAIRGLATTQGAGPSEAKSVTAFLAGMPLRKKGSELIIEAIRTLGKIGDGEAASFLSGYERVRWWKPRRLQEDVRAAALGAQEEIKRRSGGVGRAG
jgi:HEAT repeat protein